MSLSIVKLKKIHYNDAVECLALVFPQHEPITQALNISYQEMKGIAHHLVTQAITDQLSFVVLDDERGNIAAISINEEHTQHTESAELPTNFLPIADILSQTKAPINCEPQRSKRKFHMLLGAVYPEYRKLGLQKRVTEIQINLAIQLGFDSIFLEATNQITHKNLTENFGFKILNSVSLNDYRYNGKAVFHSVDQPKAITLLSKDLS